jgi:hypothetical protein
MKSNQTAKFASLTIGLWMLACVVAWFTHVIYCFGQLAWGFLIAGAVFFPVGILHGFYLWFS